jgi:hypothetical protein
VKEEAQAALARVAASQDRELAARKARDAAAEDLVANGEAAAPVAPVLKEGQALGAGPHTVQVGVCPVEGMTAGPEVVTREVSPLPCSKPPRNKAKRSTLMMRKGRGKRTVSQ